jgi:hypothetical protein
VEGRGSGGEGAKAERRRESYCDDKENNRDALSRIFKDMSDLFTDLGLGRVGAVF